MSFSCDLAGRCGGCPWHDRPYPEQLATKQEQLATAIAAAGGDGALARSAPLRSVGEAGLRDRADLALRIDGDAIVCGLWDLGHEALVDVPRCPQMSPALAAWYEELRADLPPIAGVDAAPARASLRLRVAPNGTRGVWLDLANVAAKALLDEGAWLGRQLARGVAVEIGQRRKPVVPREGGGFGLGREASLGPWFRTWLGDEAREAALYGPVGGFSQPGLATNRALVALVRDAYRPALRRGARRWLELGAGQGNLTLPLAADGAEVVAVDTDGGALEGLRRALDEHGLGGRVRVEQTSLDGPDLARRLMAADAVLADPPRSGLRGTLDALAGLPAVSRPVAIVYVSCHPEALALDTGRLAALGYRLVALEGLDQFPQTGHVEWIGRFERDSD